MTENSTNSGPNDFVQVSESKGLEPQNTVPCCWMSSQALDCKILVCDPLKLVWTFVNLEGLSTFQWTIVVCCPFAENPAGLRGIVADSATKFWPQPQEQSGQILKATSPHNCSSGINHQRHKNEETDKRCLCSWWIVDTNVQWQSAAQTECTQPTLDHHNIKQHKLTVTDRTANRPVSLILKHSEHW